MSFLFHLCRDLNEIEFPLGELSAHGAKEWASIVENENSGKGGKVKKRIEEHGRKKR